MKIVHTGDMHLHDWRFGDPSEIEAHARRVVKSIIENEDAADTVVCDTGDMMQHGGQEECDAVRRVYEPLLNHGFQIVACPGNHDLWWNGLGGRLLNRFLGGYPKDDEFDALASDLMRREVDGWPVAFRRGPVVFIAANSSHRHTYLASGYLGEEQIDYIADTVRTCHNVGVAPVILVHHCLSGGQRSKRLQDRRELGDALEEAGGVSLILSGHLHEANSWSGVFGADRLVSTPAMVESKKYRRLECADGRWSEEWVEVV